MVLLTLLSGPQPQPTSRHGAQMNWLARDEFEISRKLSGNDGQCAVRLSHFSSLGIKSEVSYRIDHKSGWYLTQPVYEMVWWFSSIDYKCPWVKPDSFCWEDAGRGFDRFPENLGLPNNQELQNHGTRSVSTVDMGMRDPTRLFCQWTVKKPRNLETGMLQNDAIHEPRDTALTRHSTRLSLQ